MDTNATEILTDLSVAASATRKNGRSVGRYTRTPKFESPASRSSRPSTGAGFTFHFAHKALSKRSDISESSGSMTSASAHQGYIERKEAGAVVDEKSIQILKDHARSRDDAPQEKNNTSEENGSLLTESDYKKPPFSWSEDRMGFGTLGAAPNERKEFWNKVERSERRTGRVQSRIIAELPHETTQEERLKIALEFCQKLDELGLPYWASIHAPTKKNDSRNHHLHIAYSERPAKVSATGEWDFEKVVAKKKKNRSVVKTRPYRQNRIAEVRNRGWVKELRKTYAEVSNTVLEKGSYEKRLDPRSYKEIGLSKEPTRHLGFKAHAMETFGLDTKVGVENAQKEMRWKIAARTNRWERAIALEGVSLFFEQDQFSPKHLNQDNQAENKTRETKISEGHSYAKIGAESEVLAEMMGLRFGKRVDFLTEESARLLKRGRGLEIASASQDIQVMKAEEIVLKTREPDLNEAISLLEEQAKKSRKKEAEIWEELYGKKTQEAQNRHHVADVFGNDSWDNNLLPLHEEANNKTKKEFSDFFEKESKKTATLARPSSDTLPTEDTIKKTVQAPEKVFSMGMNQTDDQGILLIGKITNAQDVQSLDAALIKMTNKDTRMRAIATRDLVDVLEASELRDKANRGWIVLKSEAERRGLNLETGSHDPSKGTDRERAALHKDEYLSTVLEVRQEVTRSYAR